jgi:hypothetical protein
MRNLFRASKRVKCLAYLTIVRPTLEYGSILWDPHQIYLIDAIEAVQRRAARYVCKNFSRFDSVTQMISELGWEALSTRRYYARLKTMFKIICDNEAFKDLKVNLQPANYIGRHDHHCKIREINVSSDSEKYSFMCRTIRDWNMLPASIFNHAYKTANDFIAEAINLL